MSYILRNNAALLKMKFETGEFAFCNNQSLIAKNKKIIWLNK